MINDETSARRLARAILTDISLYNESKILGAADLRTAVANELNEGNVLFASRVVPELAGTFAQAVGAWLADHGQPLAPGAVWTPTALPPAPHPHPHPVVTEEPRLAPANAWPAARVVRLLVLALLLSGILAFIFLHRP